MGVVAKPINAERIERRPPNGVWVVAEHSTITNEVLVGALHERGVRAQLVKPARLAGLARRGDLVLGRLDVRRTLTASRTASASCAGLSAAESAYSIRPAR